MGSLEDESMDEETAYEIAIRIRDEFEDLLDEKNIKIPSAGRTGQPEEACLYGEEYWRLEDAIADVLADLPDTRFTDEDIDYASHPLRQLAIRICEEFEELLAENGIKIQSDDRDGDPEEACLYGSEYYALEDGVVDILMEELAAGAKGVEAAAISGEARVAVATMQNMVARAPEGFAKIGSAKAGASLAEQPGRVRSIASVR